MKTSIMIVIMLVLGAYPLYSAADVQSQPSGEEQLVPPPVPSQEQPEVLTRGPVHEAFAEPVNIQVQAGMVAPKPPPANIVEIAPPQRPTGEQFVLVPGYWSWDEDRNDYIWVSACWRAAPPNMYWVPGYWARVDEGWEWVAGFWAQSGIQEIEYLPAPPPLEDIQPPGPPPSEDYIWVPLCQYWHNDHYVRRPGYWLAAQQGWVWVPSHYIWTPRGYVFSPGHWDYSLERRGMLFAPVYFPRSVYVRAGFSYSPNIVISIGMLQVNLFTCPRYSHYYFGDYYDDVYLRVGIFPRFESERFHTWYDPIYVYDRWHNHRTEPRWEDHERNEYNLRRADRDLRPPRTYHEMETRQARMPEQQRKNIRMARPLTEVVASRATMRFEQINPKTQRNISAQATEVYKFRDERNRWESSPIAQKTAQPAKEHKGLTQPPEHKEPVSVPVEHRGPVMQPSEHKEPVSAPVERKAPVTQPFEHKEPVPAPVEHKGLVTQPSEHKEPVSAPVERKGPVTQPSEHKEPVSAPMEHKGSVTQPADRTPAFVSPREVRATKSEKVKIPKSPIVGESVDSSKSKVGPPPKPDKERQQVDDAKDKDKGPDKERQKVGDTKDKDKGRDKDKGK